MHYIVLEIQTNLDGTVGTLAYDYTDRNVAEQKYHTVLAAAAVSEIPTHAAVLMTNEGVTIESKMYHYKRMEV